MSLQTIQDKYTKALGAFQGLALQKVYHRMGAQIGTTERGMRTTPENAIKYMHRYMWVDPELRAAVLDIRNMDRVDPRVKKIHRRTITAAIRGGLKLDNPNQDKRIQKVWDQFQRRLKLHRREKLFSDGRGLMMEGNLMLQWVLDKPQSQVVAAVRMPSDTILPSVAPNGRYKDPRAAFEQYDLSSGAKIATFPLWQLAHTRLSPDNFDDHGSMGRPYLDATRSIWRKLTMTEEDLVIRRHMRAPKQNVHVLENPPEGGMEKYIDRIEKNQQNGGIDTDFFIQGKGTVSPVQGDASLDQIADVELLMDTFFAGSPAPKGLFGYAGDLSRDILEDLKRDFFEEVDAIQDEQAYAYQQGFELQLMLSGINPDNFDFTVKFAERRTETPNQAADRGLKLQALGASQQTSLETAGLDADQELTRKAKEKDKWNPYPSPNEIGVRDKPKVSITPGNKPKGESATEISTRTGND